MGTKIIRLAHRNTEHIQNSCSARFRFPMDVCRIWIVICPYFFYLLYRCPVEDLKALRIYKKTRYDHTNRGWWPALLFISTFARNFALFTTNILVACWLETACMESSVRHRNGRTAGKPVKATFRKMRCGRFRQCQLRCCWKDSAGFYYSV